MRVRSVVYPPQRGYPMYITAKCYTSDSPMSEDEVALTSGVTLLLLHSTSFHKETFEPTLEDLFGLVSNTPHSENVRIREAWIIDCPNHGEAAILNEKLLKTQIYEEYFGCERYAEAVYHFLTAGEGGPGEGFTERSLVGIGHSLGAAAMIFLSAKLRFATIVVVDPVLSPEGPEPLAEIQVQLIQGAYERRDVWPSREAAYQNLKSRTKSWDERVLRLFVKYGIREHPSWSHEHTPYKGYTLACTRDQEVTMYRDADGHTKPVRHLDDACQKLPVHIVFGDDTDFVPKRVQGLIITPPRRFASITWLPGINHLVPQQAPKELANIILSILQQLYTPFKPRL